MVSPVGQFYTLALISHDTYLVSSLLSHTPMPTLKFRNPVRDEIIMKEKLQHVELEGAVSTVCLSLEWSKDLIFLRSRSEREIWVIKKKIYDLQEWLERKLLSVDDLTRKVSIT